MLILPAFYVAPSNDHVPGPVVCAGVEPNNELDPQCIFFFFFVLQINWYSSALGLM